MRTSQFPLNTVKETPADAEIISHQLMIRAGLIRKLAAGLYSWLPLGLRVLRKVEKITREEMEKAGALEVLMPALQPAELWQETGRWQHYGPELARLKDRHERDFCLGPTHEEIITDLARHELKSYKQLPITYYQIQTKFRDEIRPRFGVMRCREFIMKDAYSFHLTQESLQETYDVMYTAYSNIFNHLGLNYRAVIADSGSIGGAVSHEFHVLADSGEDAIAFSTESDYAANVESATAFYEEQSLPEPIEAFAKVATPTQKTIAEISKFLNVPAQRILKTIAVVAMQRDDEGNVIKETFYDLFLRGDHELNEIKTRKIIGEFRFAIDEEIIAHHGCIAGFLGPKLDAKHPSLFDHAVKYLSDFVCGANEAGFHLRGCHWAADSHTKTFYEQALTNAFHDLRNVVAGDKSPDGKGEITLARGIEVGHIFQLGTKYSASMKAGIINEAGKNQIMIMGCYGIGISRVVAAAIEQNHDARGIIWPAKLAPFQVALLPMNLHKSERLKVATEKLYADLVAAGIDVLFDDRKVRAGFMFSDMELIGIPHSIIISDRGLDEGTLEYKARTATDNEIIPSEGVIEFLKAKLA